MSSGMRNVSGGLQVCSGRRVGAMLVVVRLDEAHLVFFSQSLPVLQSDPSLWHLLLKQHSPTISPERQPCHK